MSETYEDPATPSPSNSGRWSRMATQVRVHPWRAGSVVIVILAGATLAYGQIRDWVDPPYQNATLTLKVPDAPRLTASGSETVYRIDPSRSTASYEIQEQIVGRDAGSARGTSHGIAGDFAVDVDRPSSARLGDIVVDVEQFQSDSALRDARIRSDYLEPHEFPLATFSTNKVSGLDNPIGDSADHRITLDGTLKVKETSRPVSWSGTVRLADGQVRAKVTTSVKMSDFGVGPISIVGLVSTEDRVDLTLELVAVDPTTTSISTEIGRPEKMAAASPGNADTVSFSRTVQPILEANCVSCHRSGAIGASVLTLDKASDARKVAGGLATVVGNGYMPPWPPSDKGVLMREMRSLSPDQIAAIQRWADTGGALDVPETTKLAAVAGADPVPPRSDVVMKMAEPYATNGELVNDFRCFVFDPKFTTPTFVTGTQFTPGTTEIVHHALLYRTSAALMPDFEAKDKADSTPGWNCDTDGAPAPVTGPLVRPNRVLLSSWVPGNRPQVSGPDQGYLFEPGDKIIVQIHYHHHGSGHHSGTGSGKLTDQSTVSLQIEAPTPEMHDLVSSGAAGPVELPCPASATGPFCDREAALTDMTTRFGPTGRLVNSSLNQVCGANSTTSDPVTGNGTSRCDWLVATTGQIVDVMGHMHTRGSTIRLTLNPGTPDERILLDIPRWNFNWQISYQPVDPVPVKAGDRLRIECSWDRANRIDPDPRYIFFDEGTEDEMCFATYTVNPTEPAP